MCRFIYMYQVRWTWYQLSTLTNKIWSGFVFVCWVIHVGVCDRVSPSTGSYSEWINCHPEYLSCVIPLILQGLQGLQNSEIAESATMSLKDVTAENLDHIQPYAPQILGTCQVQYQSCKISSPVDCWAVWSGTKKQVFSFANASAKV